MTPWTAPCQDSKSFTISQSFLKFMSIESMMPSNHLILYHPLFPLSSIFPKIRWQKYWSFSSSISPSNEYSELIFFRIDWFDLFAAQGTLESSLTPQFKSINLQRSAFFMVQLSHPHMTNRKNIALAIWTFFGKVMSLLFNMMCRSVIAFLPRRKCLLFHGCSHHLQ